ncbi:MAG: copper resistance protein B, partial [Candidatus Binataceae bacterium]
MAIWAGSVAHAQPPGPGTPVYTQYGEPPVEDNTIFYHLLFNQLEGRTNGPDNEFRWDGEGWAGTDMNKLWFKSEGFLEHGIATDGDTEALYDRPLPRLKYFDLQAGVRHDLDSNPGRTWGALGVEGLAPYWFQFAPTFYFSSDGRVAGRIVGSYDLLITNRLIAQP